MAVITFSDNRFLDYIPSYEEGRIDSYLNDYSSSLGNAFVEFSSVSEEWREKNLDVSTQLTPIFDWMKDPFFVIRRESKKPIFGLDIILRRDIIPFPDNNLERMSVPVHDPSAQRVFFQRYAENNSRSGYEIIIKPHNAKIVEESQMTGRHFKNGFYLLSHSPFPDDEYGFLSEEELSKVTIPPYESKEFKLFVQNWAFFKKNKLKWAKPRQNILIDHLSKDTLFLEVMPLDAEEYWIKTDLGLYCLFEDIMDFLGHLKER